MELISQPKYFKFAELNKGDVLIEEGVYLETKEGRFGPQHYFEDADGERKVLNSSGQLNYLIDSYLTEGDKCKIQYQGKIELTKGAMKGKSAHQFDLFKDKKAVSSAPVQTELNLNDSKMDDLS